MKGLFAKDYRLLMQRKNFFFLLLFICVIMSFTTDISFIVGYMVMVFSIFSVSTITYDEYDNCYPFLMTMPITSKTYVTEKYIFGFALGLASWIVSIILYLLVSLVRPGTLDLAAKLPELLPFIPLFILMLDLMIPAQLKWGAEKSRIVLMVAGGLTLALGMLILNPEINPGISASDAPAVSGSIPSALIAFIVIAATAALTALSMWLSMRIMDKKEY